MDFTQGSFPIVAKLNSLLIVDPMVRILLRIST
ncbi:MAG: Uncharacterised protein [Flavobacteriales bacterium UBA4585]|nr:MAG: Uncharacterised protein [Flavobacteriales bacterium UBA4585]